MEILDASQFSRLTLLVSRLDIHLALRALIGGCAPGKVYVDSTESPASFIAWTGHLVYAAGKAGDAQARVLCALLDDDVIPYLRTVGHGAYEVKADSPEWLDLAERNVPAGMEGVRAERQHFSRTGPAPLLQPPAGLRLTTITRSLLGAGVEGSEALEEELVSERPSVEEFLTRSFGVAALDGNRLAGWCTSEYNCGDRCEVGIGTQEPYRRRGLATAMCARFIQLALDNGVSRIGWHCFARNEASVATALKLGFVKTDDYSTWLAWFKRT